MRGQAAVRRTHRGRCGRLRSAVGMRPEQPHQSAPVSVAVLCVEDERLVLSSPAACPIEDFLNIGRLTHPVLVAVPYHLILCDAGGHRWLVPEVDAVDRPIGLPLRVSPGSTPSMITTPDIRSRRPFDAAGDFDRFLDQPPYGQVPDGLPVLESLDPFGTTVVPSGVMTRLISDCVRALAVVKDGPERRGLLRLWALAEECSRRPGSALHWIGD